MGQFQNWTDELESIVHLSVKQIGHREKNKIYGTRFDVISNYHTTF